jgi:hypothetical protein
MVLGLGSQQQCYHTSGRGLASASTVLPACLMKPPAQVELLVMKALSVGLVRGSIDEVDKRVHMTWVQPRVLDLQQVRGLGPCPLRVYQCCPSFMWTEAI